MPTPIGIDLGTTFSAVAFVNDLGAAEIVQNRDSERITPSVVLIQHGEVVVGTQARRSVATAGDSAIQFVKRQMGSDAWKFAADDGRTYRPEEIASFILRRLAEDAELGLEGPVGPAVVTVPAYFDDAQRRATLDAGKLAGLDVQRVLNEPTAAALAFGLGREEDCVVMVYDLGGGTFDVTAMRVRGNDFETLATYGDRNLGGFDWDNELMTWLNDQFMLQGGPDLTDDARAVGDLRDKAELAKRTLSVRESTSVFLSGGGVDAKIVVTRPIFENLTAGLLSRTRTILNMVSEDAGLSWSQVDKVLLVGGSTRMPAVRDLVVRTTGKQPEKGVNPDEVVALGAAIQAAALDPTSKIDVTIEDVTSQSLGVVVHNPTLGRSENSVILSRNTRIPASHAERYATVYDNQTEIDVEITEGEGNDLDYVKIVGSASVRIPSYPANAPIEIRMGYDIDGMVEVSVTDGTSGRDLGSFDVDRTSNMSAADVAAKTTELKKVAIF